MAVQNVYRNIGIILRRIDEIKSRFEPGEQDTASFESELRKEMKSIEKKDIEMVETGEGKPAGERAEGYDSLIDGAAEEYNIPAALIKAVIRQESNFDQDAVSPKGAMGLMQLMPSTADILGVENPFDAEDNIYGGTSYLVNMITRYGGDINRALAAYNAGPERVKSEIPNIRETKDYIGSVLEYYERYSGYERGED